MYRNVWSRLLQRQKTITWRGQPEHWSNGGSRFLQMCFASTPSPKFPNVLKRRRQGHLRWMLWREPVKWPKNLPWTWKRSAWKKQEQGRGADSMRKYEEDWGRSCFFRPCHVRWRQLLLFCRNCRGSAGRQNGHPETSMVLVVKQVQDFIHAVLAVVHWLYCYISYTGS